MTKRPALRGVFLSQRQVAVAGTDSRRSLPDK